MGTCSQQGQRLAGTGRQQGQRLVGTGRQQGQRHCSPIVDKPTCNALCANCLPLQRHTGEEIITKVFRETVTFRCATELDW